MDYGTLRRDLDDAITYGMFDLARRLADSGLKAAHEQECVGEVMYFRAQVSILDGQFAEAKEFLTRAIEANPNDGAAYNDRALCRIELEEGAEDALADFDRGIEVEPDYATIYHNKGWFLNKLGRSCEALDYFAKTFALEPDRAVTHENLAEAYLNLGDYGKATASFKQALQYLPMSCTDIRVQLETKIKMVEAQKKDDPGGAPERQPQEPSF